MIIPRQILEETQYLATQFRAISIIGPRQSGKTTLSKLGFSKKPYVNFEAPSTLASAEEDIESFLDGYVQGAIFDEI